jgi:hypothetical protein
MGIGERPDDLMTFLRQIEFCLSQADFIAPNFRSHTTLSGNGAKLPLFRGTSKWL